jgi:hypothetical protein
MKKVIFISALAIAAAVSCTKSDIVDTKFNEAISFETYNGRTAQTKAIEATNSNVNKVGLFGYYTGAGVWKDVTKANLWNNAALTKGDDGWSYEGGLKYWTNASDLYSFLAYAPYADGTKVKVSAGADGQDPNIVYTVDQNLREQEDFIYANLAADDKGQGGHVNMVKADKVVLKFKHALSRITVKVSEAQDNYDYTVYGIELKGAFNTTGTFNLYSGKWDTTKYEKAEGGHTYVVMAPTQDENQNYINGKDVPKDKTIYDYAEYVKTDGANDNYIMILPTDFRTTAAELYVTYTTWFDGHESTPMTKKIEIKQNFEQGYAYAFNLVFAPDQTNPIQFDVDVTAWENANPQPGDINPETTGTLVK